MKLVLDSETLSINCKMTDVQEVFLEQPLSNGLEEDIKNGDICNGNFKVTKETNGMANDNNGNRGTGEIVEEKVQHNDEHHIKHTIIDDVSENIQEQSNVLKKMGSEENISVSSPVKGDENPSTEEPQTINKEKEPVKSPDTKNNSSELLENTNAVLEQITEMKEIPPTEAALTSQTDECDREINDEQMKKKNIVSTNDAEKIQSENSIKIDSNNENESKDMEINVDTTKIYESVDKEPEPIKVDVDEAIENKTDGAKTAEDNKQIHEFAETEHETDAAKTTEDTTKIDESVEERPNHMEIETDAAKTTEDTTKIDESVEEKPDHMEIDEAIENETNAVKISDDTTKMDVSVEIESEPIKIDQIMENGSGSVILANETDEKENTSDDIIVKISEPSEPIAEETGNYPKHEVDKCEILKTAGEVCTSVDVTETTTTVEVTADIPTEKPEGVIEIDCLEKEQVIDVDSSDKDTIPKEDSVPDAIFSSEDPTDGCTIVDTKEKAVSTNTQKIHIATSDSQNMDVATTTDIPSEKPESVIKFDCIEKEQVIDVDSSDKDTILKEDNIPDALFSSEDSTDGCTVVETNKQATRPDTQKMDVATPGTQNLDVATTADIPSEKQEGVIEIDCIEKEQVIDVDSSDKDTMPKEDSVPDAILSSEDSSDGCTVVETKKTAATPDTEKNYVATPDSQKMDVDTPVQITESESKISEKDTDFAKSTATSPKPKTISGLSNTLDIISDDEDETPLQAVSETITEDTKVKSSTDENKCINLDDDDDIMLIDEDPNKDDQNENVTKEVETLKPAENSEVKEISKSPPLDEDNEAASKLEELLSQDKTEESMTAPVISEKEIEKPVINDKTDEKSDVKPAPDTKSLVPANFLKTFKSNVAEMTRDELEEFCLIKIVEGIVEKSNLTEIKSKLKTMSQNIEEWRKKAMMLTKQNRDLQIVLKTVQEEQKKRPDLPITPLKITRSVGMQVFMTEANERGVKRGRATAMSALKAKPLNLPRQSPKPINNPPIPVPRLVPAMASSPAKPRATTLVQSSAISSNTGKASPTTTTVKTPPVKTAEKRPLSSGSMSFTVDLTDDEPPAKQMPPRQAPVRLVAQQHLMAPRATVNSVNSPRKVYIPINSQNQNQLRQGNAIMLKAVTPLGPRQRPPMVRLPNNSAATVRPMRAAGGRHPAALPDVAKQQQPPNWKALPPSPDLKISKVENGIVISWKIEDYQEDSYEEIASYQLYAYQETSSPPSTLLWRKIGDVKALPLPMACTLTQFMAGYKYYFAVRAVDIRSRIGPFSLPGSILLLNK